MEKPTIVFLQETKCSSEEMEKSTRRIWKGAQVVEIDVEVIVGGLLLLWNSNLVSFSNICAMHLIISAQFHILGSETKGVVMKVYNPF
jgi:hypothetical protein